MSDCLIRYWLVVTNQNSGRTFAKEIDKELFDETKEDDFDWRTLLFSKEPEHVYAMKWLNSYYNHVSEISSRKTFNLPIRADEVETLNNIKNTSVGRKDDTEKLRYDLIPPNAQAAMVRVLGFGAAKYGDFNWSKVEDARRRYFAAMMRHAWAWWNGEKADPDTGESHLAHALCCAMFLLEMDLEK